MWLGSVPFACLTPSPLSLWLLLLIQTWGSDVLCPLGYQTLGFTPGGPRRLCFVTCMFPNPPILVAGPLFSAIFQSASKSSSFPCDLLLTICCGFYDPFNSFFWIKKFKIIANLVGLGEGSSVFFFSPLNNMHGYSDKGFCNLYILIISLGFPGSTSCKEPAWQWRRCKRWGFDPWVGKIPWRRAWQLTPLFLPGESHGQRSLVGYRP